MKRDRILDMKLADYADALVEGKRPALGVGQKERDMFNALNTLYQALRPQPVPDALAQRVRERVGQEIAACDVQSPAGLGAWAGRAKEWAARARAFLRRAGELVVNVELPRLWPGPESFSLPRPAEVYAYSVIEALDKAARRRKARILMDAKGRIYEVPQAALKQYAVPKPKGRKRALPK